MIAGKSALYIVLVVVVLALMFSPLPIESLWLREALNSGHTIFFFFLSFYAYHGLKKQTNLSNTYLIVVIIVFVGIVFGILIEAVQQSLQREASIVDLCRDVVGIFAGLCLVASGAAKKVSNQMYRFLSLAMAVALILFAMAPLMQLSMHYIQRNSAFPVVIDLGANWSESFIVYNHAELLHGDDQGNIGRYGKDKLHQVLFGPGRFPGVSIREPVADWSSYRLLKFSVVSNVEGDVVLVLRIHDKQHNQDYSDRFNQALIVHPGVNDYAFALASISEGPEARELDLSQIAGIILFLSRQSLPAKLSIGDLYLE